MKGEGELTLCTYGEPDNLCVEICDNGPGIPKEIMPRLLTRSLRQNRLVKAQVWACTFRTNIIVLKHHGRLTVESKPGYTCFKIALPFSQSKKN